MFEKLQFALLIAVPRLLNFGYDHDNVILASEDTGPVESDIEKEMQMQLQKCIVVKLRSKMLSTY